MILLDMTVKMVRREGGEKKCVSEIVAVVIKIRDKP